MKKLVLSIAFVVTAQISFSQDVAFKSDVLKMISLSSSDAQMKKIKGQFLKIIPVADQAAFSKEYDRLLPGFQGKLVKIYMETYTHEDIKGIIAFYESPVGKKMTENAGIISEKSMQAAVELATELQGISSNYKKNIPAGNTSNVSDVTVYSSAGIEVKPEFPGGLDEFYKFFNSNFSTPKVEGLKGKIFVTFIIEKDGGLTDIKVLRDIGHGTGKEAVRVLQLSPKWKAAEQNGKKVRCTYSLPIAIQS